MENHKKKVPIWGPYALRLKAGETRTALLEVRKAPQKQCENNFVATKCFLQNEWRRTFGQWVLLSQWPVGCRNAMKQCCHMHVLVPPKKWKWKKKNGRMIKCLLTKWGRVAALGPYVLTLSQIFSCPALPLSQ